MKIIFQLLLTCKFLFASNYIFLVDEYNKEIELEAKIISNIATNSIKNEIKLYIPNISKNEKAVYSKFLKVVDTCEKSNFIFRKRDFIDTNCNYENKIYFTNNYNYLISNKSYLGAFFWSKSRPNIVFVKNRLAKSNIILPESFKQFIEDFE